jgi:sulfatase modifying factor 1
MSVSASVKTKLGRGACNKHSLSDRNGRWRFENRYLPTDSACWSERQEKTLSDMKAILSQLSFVALLAAAVPFSLQAETDAPRIVAVSRTNGGFSLVWTNTGTNPVTVERRTSLTAGSWTAIASNNTVGAHSDTNIQGTAAFYRVVMVTGGAPPANMALIPAGSFEMGNSLAAAGDGASDELPVHTVNVSAFYLDKYEVTKALWDEVRAWGLANGYTDLPIGGAEAANRPVSSISWFDAVKWSNARSQMEELTPCYTLGGVVMKTGTSTPDCNFAASGYRLPTEAEWEKAARGGLSGKRFPWGDSITHSHANYYSNGSISYDVSPTQGHHPTYGGRASPVGSFAPNGYGVYDMAGNLWEWCWDWYSSDYYTSSTGIDPRGPSSGWLRMVRGGSWYTSATATRSAERGVNVPADRGFHSELGFRCARSSVP